MAADFDPAAAAADFVAVAAGFDPAAAAADFAVDPAVAE